MDFLLLHDTWMPDTDSLKAWSAKNTLEERIVKILGLNTLICPKYKQQQANKSADLCFFQKQGLGIAENTW